MAEYDFLRLFYDYIKQQRQHTVLMSAQHCRPGYVCMLAFLTFQVFRLSLHNRTLIKVNMAVESVECLSNAVEAVKATVFSG